MNIMSEDKKKLENTERDYQEVAWFYNYKHLQTIQNKLDAIKALTENNLSDMSNEEAYKVLSTLFTVTFTPSDILEALSRIYGQVFDKFEILNTRMVFEDRAQEGTYKDFSWWNEAFLRYFIVATTEDTHLDITDHYSKEYIDALASSNKIVRFGMDNLRLGYKAKPTYLTEPISKIDMPEAKINHYGPKITPFEYDLDFELSEIEPEYSELNTKIREILITNLKSSISQKNLLEYFKNVVLYIESITSILSSTVEKSRELTSQEKEEYLSQVSKIKNTSKQLVLSLSN